MQHLPRIIQGGMGVAVSSWPLASAVARRGQLGVVSGTGIDAVVSRRLQLGDPGGYLRRAFDAFPLPDIAARVWDKYFIKGGKGPATPYRSKPIPSLRMPSALRDLLVISNFVEVFLAKMHHGGMIGINLLEKVQLTNLPSLFGAMLAKVDVVLMGAGIPRSIPGVLDRFAAGEPAEIKVDVAGAQPGEEFHARFDPHDYLVGGLEPPQRPKFLAIVASSTLATTLVRKSSGKVDGFVVEGPTAGGHNAPPRGSMSLDGTGQPIYGPRDAVDIEQIRSLGLPFWLAGSYSDAGKLEEAIGLGAQGIQVGTAFAFCEESGLSPQLKREALQASREGRLEVFTDPQASPTGFPFKVLGLAGTMSEPGTFEARERICDLGYLRHCYREADGTVGYRCPGEPQDDYLRKGGSLQDVPGRKCLCNGLVAAVDLPQIRRSGTAEPALVTAGDDSGRIHRFLRAGRESYSANDVLDALLGASEASPSIA